MSADIHLEHIAALAPLLNAEMACGRRACQLPDAVVRGTVEAGLFRLWIPRRYGGFELTLPMALQVYEAAARVDGSFGWAVMIGSGGGLFAAYLDPGVASALYRPRAAVVAGSGAPTGTAERVPGGYRATGRWRYASGADYATVFTANCRVTERGQPVPSPGEPLIRAMSFAPADVTLHRTWDPSGLRATGSHDIAVTDVFVAESATFSVFTDVPREAGALYRIPFDTLTELPVAAVALGIAHHALEAFAALARSKPAPGGGASLAQHETVQDGLHAARTRVEEAGRRLHEQGGLVWQAASGAGHLDVQIRSACARASVRAVRELVAAIAELVPLAGMNALLAEDPFAVAWRDLEAAAAHYSVTPLSPALRPASPRSG